MKFINDRVFKTSGMVLSKNRFVPISLKMTMRVILTEHDQGDSYIILTRKSKHLEEYIAKALHGAIFFSGYDDIAKDILLDENYYPKTGNFLVEIPTMNSISIGAIGTVLYAKFNSLMDDSIKYLEVEGEINGDESISTYFDPIDDEEILEGYNSQFRLPVLEKWKPDGCTHSSPWWLRSDGSTMDLPLIDESMKRAYCGYNFQEKNIEIKVFKSNITVS